MLNPKFLLFLLIGIFFFVACENDKTPNETIEDFEVVTNISKDPEDLIPLTFDDINESRIARHLFSELMAIDPVTMEQVPFMVKDYPVVEQNTYNGQEMTSYTYELREEATWQDGQPILAEDVHFSMKLIFNPLLPNNYANYLSFVYGFKLDDSNNRKFTIYANQDYFLADYVLGQAIFLYPKTIFDTDNTLENYHVNDFIRGKGSGVFAEDIALEQFTAKFTSEEYKTSPEKLKGAGAYKIANWYRGQQVVLEKVENWWGESLAKDNNVFTHYPKQLIYNVIKDEASIQTAILNDEFDVMVQVPMALIESLGENEAVAQSYDFLSASTMKYFSVALNNKQEALSSKKVRQALAHLVDVDLLNKELYAGKGKRITGPINPQLPYYNKDLKLVEYNVEKAAALLKADGWADTNNNGTLDKMLNGAKVELDFKMILPGSNPRTNRIAEIVSNGFAKCNVKLSPEPVEVKDYLSSINTKNYELTLLSITGQVVDDLKTSWHSEADRPGGGNRVAYFNPAADKLMDEIRVTKDKERLITLHKEFQAIIYEDQPMIFLISPMEQIIIDKAFENQVLSPERPYIYEEYLKLK